MTARDAEHNAAIRMRELGFDDAAVGTAGPDGGIDVRSLGAVAQVKYWYKPVGTPELQRLFGARGNHRHLKMLFFARTGYARGAVIYADQHEIALFAFDDTGAISPRNETARSLVSKRGSAQRGTAQPAANKSPRFLENEDPVYLRQRNFKEVGCQIAEARMRELGFSNGNMVMGVGAGLYNVLFVDYAVAGIRVTRGAVGRFTLQELNGVEPHGRGEQRFYFSCDGYSDDAIVYADSFGIALFTYGRAATTSPSNHNARELINRVKR